MKLIVLDRDGVINSDSDEFIRNPDQWEPIPGSLEAIAKLTHAGFLVTVATNQSGLARDLFDITTLNAIHEKMYQAVSKVGGHIDAIFYCPHGPDDNCNCRKPLPGLMLQIAKRFSTSMEGVPAIGDSIRDLQAAEMVGASPILVRTGKGAGSEACLADYFDHDIATFDNLADAVPYVLQSFA